ncbi:MBL fold metallo-hydrolase [bacterium]|jgi:L-ascorbate metabolism protein UlaG (beta-lactamase superfamily)|nr:MBL fold metallo-hydrolase [Verrucomicrobiales bacterium]MDB2326933.1 MBL fold metallo-hydrolase [bacterium]MDB4507628.1 MBL fold metallo-hydrolase [bacterium]MDC0503057.1 MBL fold metallo-hydrolase [Verrucomicrobiales bacterium]
MVSNSAPSRLTTIVRHLKDKGQALRDGGLDRSNANQIGLLPSKGWQTRNYRFLRNVVIPSIFAPRSGESIISAPASSMQSRLTWIGHATYLLQIDGKNILIDPNWAMWHGIFKRVRQPGLRLEDLPKIDLVLVSHAHQDHLHLKSLEQFANGQPILMPHGCSRIVRRLNLEPIEMKWWDGFHFEGLDLTFTPAKHWGARFVHDVHRGFGGFIIKGAERTIFHCGDSAAFDGFAEIGSRFDIDLALMPIGAYDAPSGREVHMNPEQALEAFVTLGAERMAPMHYGSFPLGGEPMHEPLERLIVHAGRLGLLHRVDVIKEGPPLFL